MPLLQFRKNDQRNYTSSFELKQVLHCGTTQLSEGESQNKRRTVSCDQRRPVTQQGGRCLHHLFLESGGLMNGPDIARQQVFVCQ
jgi:hypothetical protein